MSQRVSHVRAKPAGHTCLPAKKPNKQEMQAAKRIQACMPSHRARFGGLEGLQVIHAYQQRSQTNKNCKRRRESKPACSLIERGLEVSKARGSYMPTSKEAKQTRTASGDENPSLHAVSSSAVWRSPNSSSLLKAPCPVQEHQSLQHEVAGSAQSKRTKASSTNLQKETLHQNLVQFGNPGATEAFSRHATFRVRDNCTGKHEFGAGSPQTTFILGLLKALRVRQLYSKTKV